jgi:hypothetical protein
MQAYHVGEGLFAPGLSPNMQDHAISANRNSLFNTGCSFSSHVQAISFNDNLRSCCIVVTAVFTLHRPVSRLNQGSQPKHTAATFAPPLAGRKIYMRKTHWKAMTIYKNDAKLRLPL